MFYKITCKNKAEIKKKKHTVYIANTINNKNILIIFVLQWEKYFGDPAISIKPI